jgi:hypothetical protein
LPVTWDCDGSSLDEMDDNFLGVFAETNAYPAKNVGCELAPCAHAGVQNVASALAGATCCR